MTLEIFVRLRTKSSKIVGSSSEVEINLTHLTQKKLAGIKVTIDKGFEMQYIQIQYFPVGRRLSLLEKAFHREGFSFVFVPTSAFRLPIVFKDFLHYRCS